MRKYLVTAAIIVAVIGLALVAYLLFFNGQTSILQSGTGTSTNPFGNGAGNNATGGNSGADNNGSGSGSVSVNGGSPVTIAPRLVEIARGPVALGAVAFDVTSTSTGTTTSDTETEYVDRASGNIYSYLFRANILARLTNRTIPGIQEATWLSDGSMAYLRFLTTNADGSQHIQTYGLPSNGNTGFFLANDLSQVVSTSLRTIFSLSPNGNGSIGVVQKSDGTGAKNLFSSSLSKLRVLPAGKNYVAYTQASADLDGYVFLVDGGTGSFTRIAGPLTGVTALPSPTGTNVLLSYVVSGTLKLVLVDTNTEKITTLPIATLSEKCAWSPDGSAVYCAAPGTQPGGTLPDDWYQGATFFTDRIWRIDLSSRLAELTLDLSTDSKQAFDAVGLSVDPKNQVLVFMNKRDGSFWGYTL